MNGKSVLVCTYNAVLSGRSRYARLLPPPMLSSGRKQPDSCSVTDIAQIKLSAKVSRDSREP